MKVSLEMFARNWMKFGKEGRKEGSVEDIFASSLCRILITG